MKIAIFVLVLSASVAAFPSELEEDDEIAELEEDYLSDEAFRRIDVEKLVKRQAEAETPEMPEIPTVSSIPSADGPTFGEKAKQYWEKAKETVQTNLEKAKEKLAVAYDKAKETLGQAAEKAKETIGQAAEKVKGWAAGSK